MPIAILATGNELINGDTLNTNGHHLAKILSSEGFEMGLHVACSDNESVILRAFEWLADTHNIILVTGGLGPTSDDKTRFALSQFIQQPLVVNSSAKEHVEHYLQRVLAPEENNHQQTLFPNNAVILPNPNGTAVGCYYSFNGTLIALLPGPPRECLPMFHQFLLPVLQQNKSITHQQLKWYLFGVSESTIAAQLEKLLSSTACETGYRFDMPYLEFKVRCLEQTTEEVKQLVDPFVKPYIICPPFKKASQQLIDWIITEQVRLTFHDEITGGLLQTILQQPNTAALVSFYPKNHPQFTVYLTGLTDYWQQKNQGKPIEFTIRIESSDAVIEETHTLHFRTLAVIYAAAELTCCRLFSLLAEQINR